MVDEDTASVNGVAVQPQGSDRLLCIPALAQSGLFVAKWCLFEYESLLQTLFGDRRRSLGVRVRDAREEASVFVLRQVRLTDTLAKLQAGSHAKATRRVACRD